MTLSLSISISDDLSSLQYNPPVPSATKAPQLRPAGGGTTVRKWLTERRERKKEEARAHSAELHAAISIAGVASAVATVAVATAAGDFNQNERTAQTNMAVASAAMLVAAQCVEAAKAMDADRDQLAAAVGSAVNVRNAGDIAALTAAAATALRAAKAGSLREVWNVAAVIPVEKGGICSKVDRHLRRREEVDSPAMAAGKDGGGRGLNYKENYLGICSQEVLGRGAELLKRTRKGDLHWKIVSVYISKTSQVILKMKSKHVAGTITKNKKSVVVEVCKEVLEWSGRNLLEGGEPRRYFGVMVAGGRVIEFECGTDREHEIWTEGITHLLDISREARSHRTLSKN